MQTTARKTERSPDIAHMLKRALTKSQAIAGNDVSQQSRQLSIGVLSAKGGSGATTAAISLAAALGKAGPRACLVDAHFQNPDAAVLLGKQPEHSLAELVARRHDLGRSLFESCALPFLENQAGGFWFLSGPADGSAHLSLNLSDLAGCVADLKRLSGICVFDLPQHLDKHLVTLLDNLDVVLLLFEGTVGGVAAARRWLQVFSELEYDSKRVFLVLNRADSKLSQVEKQLPRLLGRPVDHCLPNSSALIERSCLEALPAVVAAPQDRYSRAVDDLAAKLKGEHR